MTLTKEQLARANAIRAAMDSVIPAIVGDTETVNKAAYILRAWRPGVYEVDDVCRYADVPYRCVQSHDSSDNPDWTPDAVHALWMQYHGTTPETARGWVEPTGAQDMYKVGEYMIFTDGKLYKCLSDTNYSPVDYAQAWEVVAGTPD